MNVTDVIYCLDLKQELDYCVENGIPVVSVTAVMGSTEESAVDPLNDILSIRDEYKKKVQ